MDITNFTEQELIEKIDKLLNDEKIEAKWKRASERIQRENRILEVVDQVFNYIDKLQQAS